MFEVLFKFIEDLLKYSFIIHLAVINTTLLINYTPIKKFLNYQAVYKEKNSFKC